MGNSLEYTVRNFISLCFLKQNSNFKNIAIILFIIVSLFFFIEKIMRKSMLCNLMKEWQV